MLKEKKCEICGKVFIANNVRSLYCSEPCRQKGKLLKKENSSKRKTGRTGKRKMEKDKRTINEINTAALAEHLSYGQYVAKYHLY